MSEENKQGARPKSERAFDAFSVRNDKDGKGYDIDMVATPSNGRLTLRTPQERLGAQRDGERSNTNGANRERE